MNPSPENLKCRNLKDNKYRDLCSALSKKVFDKKFYSSVAEYYFPELQKYFSPYKVKLNRDGFTADKNIDMLILNKLEDEDLSRVCLTNKYVYSLCEDDQFWMNRFIEKYGIYYDNIEEIRNFKAPASWKEYYLWLTDIIENPDPYYMFAHAAYLKRKDVMKILYQIKNIYVEEIQVNTGPLNGTIAFVKIPFDRKKIGNITIDEFKEKIVPSILDENFNVNENRVGPFKLYQDGVLLAEGNNSGYGKDNYEGEYKEFYPNGNIKKIAFFKNGELDGDAIEYYNNGQISSKIHYIHGVAKEEQSYLKNGKRIL